MQIFFITLLMFFALIAAFFHFIHYHNKSKALEGITSIQLRIISALQAFAWMIKMRMIYDLTWFMKEGDMPPFEIYLHDRKKILEAGYTDAKIVEVFSHVLIPLYSSFDIQARMKKDLDFLNKL